MRSVPARRAWAAEHPVRNAVIECQRLARRRGNTIDAPRAATEHGEAAVAHHAPTTGETPSTHRGKLCPAPRRIRPPLLRRPPHLRRLSAADAPRADDAPVRQPPRCWIKSRVEEARLLRTRTGGQVYQLHRRNWHVIFSWSSEQDHLPRGAVALLHRDRGCTGDPAA
jgi:hypothetical protein